MDLYLNLFDIEKNYDGDKSKLAKSLLLTGDYEIKSEDNKSNILTRKDLIVPHFIAVNYNYYITEDRIKRDNLRCILRDYYVVGATDECTYKLYIGSLRSTIFAITDWVFNVKCIFMVDIPFQRYGREIKLIESDNSISLRINHSENLFIRFRKDNFEPEGVFLNNCGSRLDSRLYNVI